MIVTAHVAPMQGGALAYRRSHCTSHDPHRSTQEAAVRAPVCRGGRDALPSRAPAATTLHRGADWEAVDAPRRGAEANRAERYTTQRTRVRHHAGARCEIGEDPGDSAGRHAPFSAYGHCPDAVRRTSSGKGQPSGYDLAQRGVKRRGRQAARRGWHLACGRCRSAARAIPLSRQCCGLDSDRGDSAAPGTGTRPGSQRGSHPGCSRESLCPRVLGRASHPDDWRYTKPWGAFFGLSQPPVRVRRGVGDA
jgi:hypothetical protein